MGEGAGVRSSHCLDHKEKLGLVPSFATGCWHSGLFQAVPFPGFLGQGVSPVGSSIPGRFVHPWRPRSLCTAAPGQAEELLVPSSSRGAGLHSSSSWIFLGSTSSPFGSILPCRTHRAPTQPWAGSLFPVFAGKPSPRSPPWGQGELCPLGQEHERRKGLLWAGEGCLGSPSPSQPTSTCTRPGSRYCPDPFWASPAPWALPASLLALPPGGGGHGDCVSRDRMLHVFPSSSCLEVPGLGKIPHWMENCWPRSEG